MNAGNLVVYSILMPVCLKKNWTSKDLYKICLNLISINLVHGIVRTISRI